MELAFVGVLLALILHTTDGVRPPDAFSQLKTMKKALKVKNRHLCEEYKMTCPPGDVCRVKVIMWPRVSVFPVCKHPKKFRGKTHVCREKPDVGSHNCTDLTRRWYYNVHFGRCSPFTYTGCHGNANNFDKRATCEKICSRSSTRSHSLKKRRHMWKWRNRKKILREQQGDPGIGAGAVNGTNVGHKMAAHKGSRVAALKSTSMFRKSFRKGTTRRLYTFLRHKIKRSLRKRLPRAKIHVYVTQSKNLRRNLVRKNKHKKHAIKGTVSP